MTEEYAKGIAQALIAQDAFIKEHLFADEFVDEESKIEPWEVRWLANHGYIIKALPGEVEETPSE